MTKLLPMHSTICLNCEYILQPEQPFCAQCGQKAPVHRITIPHFLHEFFHAFTHTDKGIFFLLKSLATRPGTTAREYLAGKRKKYFNPFTFFLIVMGVYVLVGSFFTKPPPVREPDQAILARIPTQAGKEKYVTMLTRGNKLQQFMATKANVVAMIAVPFIALITWLFFYRRGYNFAEHLTGNMMFIVFCNLLFATLVFPLRAAIKGSPDEPFYGKVLLLAGMVLQALYLWWSLNGFLQLRTPGARFKSLLVSLLVIAGWFFFSLTIMALYIYRNGDFYQFYSRVF